MATADANGKEHTASPEAPRQEEWNWKPSSGYGAAAALNRLKRAERVKSAWRRLRSGSAARLDNDGASPSAE